VELLPSVDDDPLGEPLPGLPMLGQLPSWFPWPGVEPCGVVDEPLSVVDGLWGVVVDPFDPDSCAYARDMPLNPRNPAIAAAAAT